MLPLKESMKLTNNVPVNINPIDHAGLKNLNLR